MLQVGCLKHDKNAEKMCLSGVLSSSKLLFEIRCETESDDLLKNLHYQNFKFIYLLYYSVKKFLCVLVEEAYSVFKSSQ